MCGMKPSSVRFFNLLISLLLLIATIFVYSVLISPAYREINQLRGDLASKNELLKNQKKIVEKVKELLSRQQSLSVPKQAVSLVLPNSEKYPELINQISGLARAANLRLESINLSLLPFQDSFSTGDENVPVVGVVQISVDLEGSYDSLKTFIQTIENNIRVMDLVKLTVSKRNQGGDNFLYNLVINAYYQSL